MIDRSAAEQTIHRRRRSCHLGERGRDQIVHEHSVHDLNHRLTVRFLF
jgi:hypothetical protein